MALTLSPKTEIRMNKLSIDYPLLHKFFCFLFMTYLLKTA